MTALLLAASLQFHGVMGQSAAKGEAPLEFTGVSFLSEGPCGRVFFGGDDGKLYELKDGEIIRTGVRMQGRFLDWDGKTVRALGQHDVWEVDPATLAFKHVIRTRDFRFDLAAVVPDDPVHPFTAKGKYVTYDKKRDALLVLDEKGAERGGLFPLPERLSKSEIISLGFLPDSGDLVAVSYYPDLRIYRFTAEGTQVTGHGWPARRGFGFFRKSGGELYHCGTPTLVRMEENLAGAQGNVFRVGKEHFTCGYAKQGDREYIGTSQGLYVKEPGETEFRKRLGGIRPLTALAVNGKYVYMSMGGTIRWMYLDEDEKGPFASSDDHIFRVNGGWTEKPYDLIPDGDNLLVAAGKLGTWRFKPFLPPAYAFNRKHWEQVSTNVCTELSVGKPSCELLGFLSSAEVPDGLEPGKIASQGKWLVVEDRKNFRLVRFRIDADKK